MSQRYNGFLIPARAERLGGAHFRLTLHPPLALADQAEHPRTAEDVLAEAHRLLEEWIRERPEQWLWIHKRWDSKNLAAEISSES